MMGIGLITLSYDGAGYVYEIDSKYYYEKIIDFYHAGRLRVDLIKKFHCLQYNGGVTLDLKDLTDEKEALAGQTPQETKTTATDRDNKGPYAAIIRSEILGEDIIILKEKSMLNVLKQEYPGVVVYSPYEINKMEVFKGAPAGIRKIHLAKKMFDGRIY